MKALPAQIRQIQSEFETLTSAEQFALNEADTRLRFILPLFYALGWQAKDVKAEEHIAGKFADFGFYLHAHPVFYLETKAVHESIDDRQFMLQAVNYAWLRGVTWAVLTNFRQIKILNAEVLESHRSVFLDLHLADYAGAGLEKLSLLSKESFQARRLDKIAEEWGGKSKKEPVTRVLFAQLTQWRRAIFQEMRGWGNLWKEDTQKLDEAVQRLLDRLIFIRTMEDRGVENANSLRSLVRQYHASKKKKKNLFQDLLMRFGEMDRVYNATLFAQHALDLMELNNEMLLSDLINGLYDAPTGYGVYDFSAIKADVLGNIYEQYLGFKIVNPTGDEAIEISNGKGKKRKSQGIFYTPTFVVDYIMQQTVLRLLEGGADPYTLRIIDPACGSGSFLIAAFDVLDRWLAEHGTDEAPSQRRRRILENNLYGVDLDPQAIEIARLNLSLRAAHERQNLPLLTHLKVGNSLIAERAVAGDLAFDWASEFPDVMAQGGFDVVVGNPPYIRAENMPKAHRDYWQNAQQYEVSYGRFDIFILFIERGLKILKRGGKLGYIIPQSLYVQNYAQKARDYILQQTRIETIVDFGQRKVFPEATINTTIITLSKQIPAASHMVELIDPDSVDENGNGQGKPKTYPVVKRVPQSYFETTPQKSFRLNWETRLVDVVEKIHHLSAPFAQFCYVVIGAVPHDSTSGASKNRLLAKQAISPTFKPYLEGKEMGRYRLEWQGRYLDYQPKMMHRPKFPELFEHEKLLIRNISGEQGILATYDDGHFYANDTVSLAVRWDHLQKLPQKRLKAIRVTIPTDLPRQIEDYDLFYFLGIINSKLMTFYYHTRLAGGLHVYPSALQQIPIRRIDFDTEANYHQQLSDLVKKMLALQARYAQAVAQLADQRFDLAEKITRLDQQIDQTVYQLYGLTEGEIQQVEALN